MDSAKGLKTHNPFMKDPYSASIISECCWGTAGSADASIYSVCFFSLEYIYSCKTRKISHPLVYNWRKTDTADEFA